MMALKTIIVSESRSRSVTLSHILVSDWYFVIFLKLMRAPEIIRGAPHMNTWLTAVAHESALHTCLHGLGHSQYCLLCFWIATPAQEEDIYQDAQVMWFRILRRLGRVASMTSPWR